MTGYVLDTDTISLFAPGRRRPEAADAWFVARSDQLYLSVATVAEILRGIRRLRRRPDDGRADLIQDWFDTVLAAYSERVLPFDLAASRIAGEIDDRAAAKGIAPGFADVVIAATAMRHGFRVVTRNRRHFEAFEVPLIDPSNV